MDSGPEVEVEQTVLVLVPPWAALSALVGAMHGAVFYLLFGSQIVRLPAAIVVALAASLAGGLVGTMIPPAVLAIGDTNLIATGIGAWAALGLARVRGLV